MLLQQRGQHVRGRVFDLHAAFDDVQSSSFERFTSHEYCPSHANEWSFAVNRSLDFGTGREARQGIDKDMVANGSLLTVASRREGLFLPLHLELLRRSRGHKCNAQGLVHF